MSVSIVYCQKKKAEKRKAKPAKIDNFNVGISKKSNFVKIPFESSESDCRIPGTFFFLQKSEFTIKKKTNCA